MEEKKKIQEGSEVSGWRVVSLTRRGLVRNENNLEAGQRRTPLGFTESEVWERFKGNFQPFLGSTMTYL